MWGGGGGGGGEKKRKQYHKNRGGKQKPTPVPPRPPTLSPPSKNTHNKNKHPLCPPKHKHIQTHTYTQRIWAPGLAYWNCSNHPLASISSHLLFFFLFFLIAENVHCWLISQIIKWATPVQTYAAYLSPSTGWGHVWPNHYCALAKLITSTVKPQLHSSVLLLPARLHRETMPHVRHSSDYTYSII